MEIDNMTKQSSKAKFFTKEYTLGLVINFIMGIIAGTLLQIYFIK